MRREALTISTLPSGPRCCAWTRSRRSRPLDRTAPILPMLPGTPQRATHEYRRHGNQQQPYDALDIAIGQFIGSLHVRHRAIEFKKFLTLIDSKGHL